jgi:hypothetical protein
LTYATANIIICPICAAQNHHLAVVCASCRSFIKPKVDNLDLFAVAWKVIESPRKAFYEIAISYHKNYALLLSAVAGFAFSFLALWMVKAGRQEGQLLPLLAVGIFFGPPLGIAIVLFHTILVKAASAITGTFISFRNVLAVCAYSLIPVIITAICILPIELLTFGVFLFDVSPSPYFLHPVSFVVLSGLDILCGVWTLVLYFKGLHVLTDRSAFITFIIGVVPIIILAECFIRIIPLLLRG